MQTAYPTGLELLLLKQVKDKTPIMRRLLMDDIDEHLEHEEIKVELYKDGYAIYFVEPGYRTAFDLRTANFMALIRFSADQMDLRIQIKPWRRNYFYMVLLYGFLISLLPDFLTRSIGFSVFLVVIAPLFWVMLQVEKRNFRKRLDSFLLNLQGS